MHQHEHTAGGKASFNRKQPTLFYKAIRCIYLVADFIDKNAGKVKNCAVNRKSYEIIIKGDLLPEIWPLPNQKRIE